MAELIAGYACPICCNVLEENEETCSEHQDALMDLNLDTRYQASKTPGESPWRLLRRDSDGTTSEVCSMNGATQLDLVNADRIICALNACREISTLALRNGYIQTLQQLPLLISDHLNQQTTFTEERLRKQLALVQSRGRSIDLSLDYPATENTDDDDDEDEREEDDDYEDFDLISPKLWHASVWQEIVSNLKTAGFQQEEQYVFSKQLTDDDADAGGRLAIVNLSESYKRNSLEVAANVATCHETFIETIQRLMGFSRSAAIRQTELKAARYTTCEFDVDNQSGADELVAAIEENLKKQFHEYPDLRSLCLGLIESANNDAYTTPLAQALLGDKNAAIALANEWIVSWSAYPRNAEHTAKYKKTFVQGLKKIKSIL